MLNFENVKIPKEWDLLCVVNKTEGLVLFSDELIEVLYLNIREKWLSLKAFRHIILEEEHEERLYIAYDPYLNKGKEDKLEKEVRHFFTNINKHIVLESGRKVKAMSRSGYKAVITNSSLASLCSSLHYQYDPYYKPFLLDSGLSEDKAVVILSQLDNIKKYTWYRTKHKYVGVKNTSANIYTYLDEFVCLNKDEQWEEVIQAMKDYQDFVDNKKSEFVIKYTKQEEKNLIREKVLKGEAEELNTKISISDEADFLKNNGYDAKSKWNALIQLYNCGWNDYNIKGYKDEHIYLVDMDEMQAFVNGNSWRSLPLQFHSYLYAIKTYLEYKWNIEHHVMNDDIEKNDLTDSDNLESIEENVTTPVTEKKIRVDINMDDIDEFLDYLESRVPERHSRKRYVENIKDLHSNGWNKYRHSTFIDDKKYKVSGKDVEVFVNGMKSRNFNVSVKEYEDALELYLSYRWAKDYSRPMYDDKEEAIPPLVKERKKKEIESPSQETQEGKKIFVNISHLDSWESSKKESASEPKEGQGVVYIGDPTGQRKSVTLQNASITESDQSVDIKIEMTNLQEEKEVVNEDFPTSDVPISPVEEEKTELEERNQKESVKPSPKNDVTKEEDRNNKEKTIAKKKMGWLARIMLRFWAWFYKVKVRDNSPKKKIKI